MKNIPHIKKNICLNVNPKGCEQSVDDQITYSKEYPGLNGPKKVLVIGGSTGFGLASRIIAAFSYGADTVSVAYEKQPKGKKNGTAGWYNTERFEKQAQKEGLASASFYGDAFSHEIKQEVCDYMTGNFGKCDLIIYSIATSRRIDPCTGVLHKGVIKPVNTPVFSTTINLNSGTLESVAFEQADDMDIFNTIKVMGGEDWLLWIKALSRADLLADNCITVAFSYMGPDLTSPIYRQGTLGKAKQHLEETVSHIDAILTSVRGKAYVSINKALVTKSSSVIPIVPLYIAILYKVMKSRGVHEGCIEQMSRLFHERLYSGTAIHVDDKGRIRIDDLELDEDVQSEVVKIWQQVNDDNLLELTDYPGYLRDFLGLAGFTLDDFNGRNKGVS